MFAFKLSSFSYGAGDLMLYIVGIQWDSLIHHLLRYAPFWREGQGKQEQCEYYGFLSSSIPLPFCFLYCDRK
jgi:hypothetical protein